jgi:hypothetical protein
MGSQPCFHCILIFPVEMLKSLHVYSVYTERGTAYSCFKDTVKRVIEFLVLSGDVTNQLSLAGNNLILVSYIPNGAGKSPNFFTVYICTVIRASYLNSVCAGQPSYCGPI